MISQYTMPELHLGDIVEVSKNANGPWTTAWVAWIGERGINASAMLPQGGTRFFPGCHHVDDPGIIENPDWLREGGVFRLAKQTILLRNMDSILARLDGLLTELTRRVTALEQENRGESEEPRRRGRPRKELPEPVEA